MVKRKTRIPPRAAHEIALPLAIFLAILLVFGPFFDFYQPVAIYGDRTNFLLQIKTFLNGYFFTDPYLGYPGEFSQFTLPSPDLTQRTLLYLLTRLSDEVFFISNLYYVFVITLCVITSYCVFYDYLEDRILAVYGSLLFLLVPYFQIRSIGQDYLAAFYSIPLTFFLIKRLIGLKRTAARHEIDHLYRSPLILISLAITALSGVYYALFSIATLIFAGVAFSYIRSAFIYLRVATIFSALIFNILFIAAIPIILHLNRYNLTLPLRHFSEQSLYGVRVSDLIWTVQQYVDVPKYNDYIEWRGIFEGYDFWPGLLLSIYGLFLIVLWPLKSLKAGSLEISSSMARDSMQLRGFLVVLVILILMFATVYGIGFLFNLVSAEIRSQNRLSPYFAFAILIVFLGQVQGWRAVATTGGISLLRTRAIQIGILSLFSIINAYPVLGYMTRYQIDLLNRADYKADMASLEHVTAVLSNAGLTHIYQMPSAPWPEYQDINEFRPYDHFLPYLFDHSPVPITWSYGLARGRLELGMLSRLSEDPDLRWRFNRMSCMGFDGILIEQRAFPATEVSALQDAAKDVQALLLSADELRLVYQLPKRSKEDCATLDPMSVWLRTEHGQTGWRYMISGWGKQSNARSQNILLLPQTKSETEYLLLSVEFGEAIASDQSERRMRILYEEQEIGIWTFLTGDTTGIRTVKIPLGKNTDRRLNYVTFEIDKSTHGGAEMIDGNKRDFDIIISKLKFDIMAK